MTMRAMTMGATTTTTHRARVATRTHNRRKARAVIVTRAEETSTSGT